MQTFSCDFSSDFVGDGVAISRFPTTSGTQNSDTLYHDQSLNTLSCCENFVKIYQMVFLESGVELSVAFVFAFSIYNNSVIIIFLYIQMFTDH